MLAAKPEGPSLSPWTHKMKRENQFLKVVLCPMCTHAHGMHTRSVTFPCSLYHTHTNKNKTKFSKAASGHLRGLVLVTASSHMLAWVTEHSLLGFPTHLQQQLCRVHRQALPSFFLLSLFLSVCVHVCVCVFLLCVCVCGGGVPSEDGSR